MLPIKILSSCLGYISKHSPSLPPVPWSILQYHAYTSTTKNQSKNSKLRPSQGFWETKGKGHLFQGSKGQTLSLLENISFQFLWNRGRNRGSYMSAHVLLNLISKLVKSKASHFIAFHNMFNKFNYTWAQMLDSIYYITINDTSFELFVFWLSDSILLSFKTRLTSVTCFCGEVTWSKFQAWNQRRKTWWRNVKCQTQFFRIKGQNHL